ncbi:hypothetical protein AKJ64_02555 [candidate division MSBL1 archaeon SCGC-AAA259E17]|uniref:Uncharacterized protein n=1 Tax=candidate division MSBL1 archaeon SCGC-AAA259E17 TaxID=1698263 RepID=A0A133UF08_9EURY|nr:hypothetical protein AKJ64_02555 [candidate division MSBL1 archaeon SCGC-AAA259E17]
MVSEDELARVYSFDLQFEGGRRTQFYRELFGYRSRTTRTDEGGHEKIYENFYPGLLTPLPHLRLGKSVIAVPKTAQGEVDNFFEDSRWESMELYTFDGILPPEDRMEAMEDALNWVVVGEDRTLESEIDSLCSLESRGLWCGADSFEKGQSFQRLTCQLLSLLGFEVVNHPPKGMPDHEVSINGGLQFAVGTRQSHETKSRTVKWRDFQSGFNFARGRGVPFMIIWWNSSRDRLWIKVVEPDELDVEDERGFKLTMPKWVWRGEEKYTEQDDKDREKSYRRARAWLRNFMEEIRSP